MGSNLATFRPFATGLSTWVFCTMEQKSKVMFFIIAKGTHWPVKHEEERAVAASCKAGCSPLPARHTPFPSQDKFLLASKAAPHPQHTL